MSLGVSSGSPAPVEAIGYDWCAEENSIKWRGIFVPSLQKVLTQVSQTLGAGRPA